MGEVYLAEDPQIDRQLAIKTVRLVGRPQEIDDRKKRLLREARAAGRLLHPNIVTLFDAGEAEGLLYLAFEFVEGTDLAARLDPGAPRLSLREVLRAVRQVAEALDYAHGQGIVHRDIKPSNILLDRAGRVKVADFGIAKMAGQSTELTMAGSVMGSPQYLSPEQIRGEDLDGRSDLFSLGVVLYEISRASGRSRATPSPPSSTRSCTRSRRPSPSCAPCRRAWRSCCAACWPRPPASAWPRRARRPASSPSSSPSCRTRLCRLRPLRPCWRRPSSSPANPPPAFRSPRRRLSSPGYRPRTARCRRRPPPPRARLLGRRRFRSSSSRSLPLPSSRRRPCRPYRWRLRYRPLLRAPTGRQWGS